MKINVQDYTPHEERIIVTDEAGQPLNEGFCHMCEDFPDELELDERCGDCIGDYYNDRDDFIAECWRDRFND